MDLSKTSKIKRRRLSAFRIILLGFLTVILVGTLLLMLPISTKDRSGASFLDALFTATSSVCVTGLSVVDTAATWSLFGQFVLLLLIQIGGLGVVSVTVLIAVFSGRKIGLFQRTTLSEAISSHSVGGVVKMTGFILRLTLLLEGIGALLLLYPFCRDFGLWKGIWFSIFHAVSAFCNAGFDIMESGGNFVSLTPYASDIYVNFVIMGLIITGGIGFFTWDDIRTNRFHLKKYHMQSKVILTVSAVLILLPGLYFFFFEFSDLPFVERLCVSLFQSVTTRTAGFRTVDLEKMNDTGLLLMDVLMLIGGSPGSTAGGMKTTTPAVLLAIGISVLRRREDAQLFGRRVPSETARSAVTVLLIYLSLFLSSAMLISRIENAPMMAALFETGSAVGTVGLSLGLTTGLSHFSKLILIFLMYCGRVGSMTVLFAVSGDKKTPSRLPQEKITVG